MAFVVAVDDDPDILALVELTLRNATHEVATAPDGPTALALIKQSPPDLLVTDHMMPDMTGLQLAKRLRGDPDLHSIPVLILTAAGTIYKDLALADLWLTKPFSPRGLVDHVDRLLRHPHSH